MVKCFNAAERSDVDVSRMLMPILGTITRDQWMSWYPNQIESPIDYIVVDDPLAFFRHLLEGGCSTAALKSYYNSDLHDEDMKNKLARIHTNHVLR